MINLADILVLDIETVSAQPNFETLEENWQELWTMKSTRIAKDKTPSEAYERAGIYAEFGKIVCVGVGFYYYEKNILSVKVRSFESEDEKQLLTELISFLKKHYNKKEHLLAAHNGKEFDFPYLCRRMIVNGLDIPKILQLSGKKPWEVQHLDTMELWKFGDFKSYTSLNLLAATLNLDSSKDDISGNQVGKVYYEEHDLDRISTYCKKDVALTAKVLAKITNNEEVKNVELV